MIEMLVTLAITIVLMLFVGQIMSQVSRAARAGIAVSHVLNTKKVTGLQLDLNKEISKSGGLLVINTNTVTAPLTDESTSATTHRDDSVMFIRNIKSDERSATPIDATTPHGGMSDVSKVKVFIGHAARTLSNGTADGDLGAAGTSNHFAKAWPITVQKLFLSDNSPPTGRAIYGNGPAALDGVTSPATYRTGYSGPTTVASSIVDIAYQGSSGILGAIQNGASPMLYSYSNTRPLHNPFVHQSTEGLWKTVQGSAIASDVGASDITIEFAGDFDGNASNNVNGMDIASNGAPVWYGAANAPSTIALGGTRNPANPSSYSSARSTTGTYATPAYVFYPSDKWPVMIRIIVRLHDDRFLLADSDGEPGRLVTRVIRVRN